jgi:polysaccharide export outer membrane protein
LRRSHGCGSEATAAEAVAAVPQRSSTHHIATPPGILKNVTMMSQADSEPGMDRLARKILTTILFTGLFAVLCLPVSAQDTRGWDPTGLQLTRSELQELLTRYEETASSASYSGPVKAQAAEEAELIRQRLEEGDIRTGDRIFLVVEGQAELTDTFNVVGNRSIILPQIGEVPLGGILRSELQTYLTTQLAKYIRNPVVHARSLIRLAILGAVTRPGYYTVPSDLLLTDALMLAGGPSTQAELDKMTVTRGEKTIWSDTHLAQALQDGRTLDQMSIRAGDAIQLPQQRQRSGILQTALIVLSGLTSLALVARQTGIF